MPPKFARLAGLGALGASAGMLGLFALIMYFTRHTATGGMGWDLAILTWISLAIVFVALIGAHVLIAKQLMYLGKNGGPTRI